MFRIWSLHQTCQAWSIRRAFGVVVPTAWNFALQIFTFSLFRLQLQWDLVRGMLLNTVGKAPLLHHSPPRYLVSASSWHLEVSAITWFFPTCLISVSIHQSISSLGQALSALSSQPHLQWLGQCLARGRCTVDVCWFTDWLLDSTSSCYFASSATRWKMEDSLIGENPFMWFSAFLWKHAGRGCVLRSEKNLWALWGIFTANHSIRYSLIPQTFLKN